MDVDDSNVVQNWLLLFGTPREFPWTTTRSAEIESRRAQMADVLIFDVLLMRGGVRQPDMLYPPTDLHSLRKLLDVINGSSYDSLKKDCLVYILLKWFQDGREATYAEERCIPPQFVSLADAYWHLDTGIHVEKAVSILSDARLNRDYASKIMQALSLSEDPPPLIVKYVRTAKPPLMEPDDIDMYALALANSSLWDAWQFQRTFPDSSETRTRLLNKLLEWCLSPKPRPGPLAQLVAFPLSPSEQSLLHAYALKPPHDIPTASIAIVQDLVCVRLVQSGEYLAAIKLDRQFSAVGSAGIEGVKAARERKKMMDDILGNMTFVERTMVEALLNQPSTSPPAPIPQVAKPAPSKPRAPLGDLSMSWEEIPPASSLNGASPSRTNSITPRISDKHANFSGSGRFEPKSSLARPASGSLITSPPQKPPVASPFSQLPLRKPVAAPLVPLVGQSGIKFAHSSALSKTTYASNVPNTSLFEKTGSAKQAPNAFYKPPPVSTGTTRALPTEDVPTRPHPHRADDISMESDDDNAFIIHEDGDVSAMPDDMDDEPELGFSVFGNRSSPEQRTRAPAIKQVETKKRAPPGAFYDEDEDESDAGSPDKSTVPRHRGASRPQPRAHSPSPRRKTASSWKDNTKGPVVTQTVPGSLLDDEEDQDEDDIAPLPPTRTARKTRTGTSVKVKPMKEEKTPARRSSRLSTTSSVLSMSPDPSPPPVKATKPRKSTRTSMAGAGAAAATRSSSRRKTIKS
ncbi:nuclear pore complex assembly-domain-containing protein [Suillus bovinus]|uniref:nuclear pore complex assembly-domain-containing protein n=1 Tax=Suillus bovinus TaxID=48563 RepID=UPI001B874E7A|nr:nuclear pore complex assembly-domain-containing protein [Suillus bovinus]KAG2156826.1 nuclear pore complex assembly-domain-containing protein [Suillus bovinus]